jgi:hypothetical protein
MVRRGSTVRVRQRASILACLGAVLVAGADGGSRLRRPRSVHQRPRLEFGRVERVEELDRMFATVADPGLDPDALFDGWPSDL